MKNIQKTRRAPALLALVAAALLGTFAISQAQQAPSSVAVPNSFVAGTPAVASEVNDNFKALGDAIGEDRVRLSSAEMRLDDAEARISAVVSASSMENVVRVAKSGGDFDSVAAAVDSIGDNAVDKPYVVLVYPGIYDESEVVDVREFIEVRGVSRDGSVIRAARTANLSNSAASVVSLRDLAALTNLTVINDGNAQISVGVHAVGASEETRIEDVTSIVDETGGVGHTAFLVIDSDLGLRDCRGVAAGATIANVGLASVGSANDFNQISVVDCEFEARGVNSGIGAQLNRTAAEIQGGLVKGDFRGVSALIQGASRIRDARVESLGLSPVYEQTGSAAILSAGVGFVGGNASGISALFTYVHCYKANFSPVVNGSGSAIE